MSHATHYQIQPTWRILFKDLGLRPGNILRRADLPGDLFARDKALISTEEYFRLWRGMEEESGDPELPLRLGEHLSVEAFDPPIFAALCSPDLNTALQRIGTYKRLICPMALHLKVNAKATRMELEWLETHEEPPPYLMAMELVFFVQLARRATRDHIVPLEVRTPYSLEPRRAYESYFGVPVRKGRRVSLSFRPHDATLPFLTANATMWDFFEPDLRKRLSQLEASASTAERVRATLMELLPCGQGSAEEVARRLGTSKRTLQRRLKQEDLSFREVLSQTRERIAKHYLKSSAMSSAEISFLLGFEDPNSFFRAFHTWTGTTPEQARLSMQAA
jgi:AraC-like DNA-binding protein